MSTNFVANGFEKKTLNGVVLKIGKNPLRLNCAHIHKLDKSGIHYEKRTITGRVHNGSGSTAAKRYHVAVSEDDFQKALLAIGFKND